MIPLKLQIKNFVSYGSKTQIIDFEKYNLICLSGKNGHGKSALLDAITWAIWGHARRLNGSHKSDEALIHMGQSTMMVALDFISKEQHYRVRREYNLCTNKKNYTTLEFGIIDKNLKTFKPLTDKNIKLTQEKIEQLIGLDYNSFINSAFFKQNQSNEFSKKSARERKEILANILGLNHFENIKKLASLKVNQATNKKEYHSQIYNQLEKETENKNIIKENLDQITKNIELLLIDENNYRNKLKEIKNEQESILNTKAHIQQIIFEKAQLDLLIKNQTNLILEEYKKWHIIFKQSKKKDAFDQLNVEYNNTISELSNLQEYNQKKLAAQEELFLKNQQLQEHLNNISKQFKERLEIKKLKEQEHKLNLDTLKNRITEIKSNYIKNKEDLEALKNKLTNIDHNNFNQIIFDKRKAFYNKFQAQIDFFNNELKDLNQKINLIQKEAQALCPLCQQSLNNNYKINLLAKLQEKEVILKHKLNRLIKVNLRLRDILKKQHIEAENFKKNIEQINIIKTKIENIINNLNSIELEKIKYQNLSIEETNNLEALKAEINLLYNQEQTQKQEDQNTNLLKTEILELEIKYNEILLALKNYKSETDLITKIKEFQELQKEHNTFLTELNLQEKRRQNISELCKNTKELKARKKQKELEYLKLKYIFEKELFFQNQEQSTQKKLDSILIEKEKLILEKGAIQEQYKIVIQKESELLEQKKILDYLNTEITDYKNIATALSKDGIQALLIESAIPEIENEANALLSLMTDNQSHIIIDSLRDLKSGNTKETLDIKISDALGLRPYELFSGGEAFKIDFALRIAISKLLARRAGASLQTLIIDEGFGSQDEEGLANIMNIIYKIQDSFSKIIIVSHLSSMKDQFPVNFLVHKTPQGTLIKIVEQG